LEPRVSISVAIELRSKTVAWYHETHGVGGVETAGCGRVQSSGEVCKNNSSIKAATRLRAVGAAFRAKTASDGMLEHRVIDVSDFLDKMRRLENV
jgi:hypothetical protein